MTEGSYAISLIVGGVGAFLIGFNLKDGWPTFFGVLGMLLVGLSGIWVGERQCRMR